MIKIAIIGGGPAAVSLCAQMNKQLQPKKNRNNIEIIVFEKNENIGYGLPYSRNNDCHILNLPKEIMEPIYGERNQFAKWIESIEKYPNKTNFPPRHFFGKYLKHIAQLTQKKGIDNKLFITYLPNNEVLDIGKLDEDKFLINSTLGHYEANYVILCTGHMPTTTYYQLTGIEKYSQDPWKEEAYRIDPHQSIGIIGTRLTTIDIALKLKQINHKGKITMVSRSGLLPTVLSKEVPFYSLKYLTLETLKKNIAKIGHKHLKLNTLNSLFWNEISEALGKKCNFDDIIKSSQDISPLEWLNKEIAEAETGAKPWQQVLFALYPLTPDIWPMLDFNDQKTIFNQFYSLFLTYLAAFPLENAYKIKDLLLSGQLEVLGGLNDIRHNDDQFIIELNNEKTVAADYLFNGTGPSYDPNSVPLLKKMITHGLISKHSLGGINTNIPTLQTINKNGQLNTNLFAVGELTKGDSFLTADIGTVTKQADRVANNLVARITESAQNQLVENAIA